MEFEEWETFKRFTVNYSLQLRINFFNDEQKVFRFQTMTLRHCKQNFKFRFLVTVFPNGVNQETEGWLIVLRDVRIPKHEPRPRDYGILSHTVSVIDTKGNSRMPRSYVKVPSEKDERFPKYLERSSILSRKDEFLPAGVLTVRCDIHFYIDTIFSEGLIHRILKDFLSSIPQKFCFRDEDQSENQHSISRRDRSDSFTVYDFTHPILSSPSFNESKRGSVIPLVSSTFSSDSEEDSTDNSDSKTDSKGSSDSEKDNKGSPGSETDSKGSSYSGKDSKNSSNIKKDSKGNADSGKDNKGSSDSEKDNKGSPGSETDSKVSSYSGKDSKNSSNIKKDSKGNADSGKGSSDPEKDHKGSPGSETDSKGSSDSGKDSKNSSNIEKDSKGNADSGSDNKGSSDIEKDSKNSSNIEKERTGNLDSEKSSKGSSNSEKDSRKTLDHVWIFDTETVRFFVSLDKRQDSVGSRLLKASRVVRKFVKHPWKERLEKRIHLPDISSRTFIIVLFFLEKGTLPNSPNRDFLGVYKFSDFFEMKDLRKDCAEEMVKSVEFSTAELKSIADSYSDKYLSKLLLSRWHESEDSEQPRFRMYERLNYDCYT